MKRSFTTLLLLSLLVLSAGGWRFGNLHNHRPQGTIAGVWTYKDPSIASNVQLTFFKDLTYALDGNADGIKDIWGTYKIFRNQITLQDDRDSNSAKDCFEPGIFYYTIDEPIIIFSILADQCPYRAASLSYQWVRVKKNRK